MLLAQESCCTKYLLPACHLAVLLLSECNQRYFWPDWYLFICFWWCLQCARPNKLRGERGEVFALSRWNLFFHSSPSSGGPCSDIGYVGLTHLIPRGDHGLIHCATRHKPLLRSSGSSGRHLFRVASERCGWSPAAWFEGRGDAALWAVL